MTMQNRRQQGRCRRAYMDVFTASSASSAACSMHSLLCLLISVMNGA